MRSSSSSGCTFVCVLRAICCVIVFVLLRVTDTAIATAHCHCSLLTLSLLTAHSVTATAHCSLSHCVTAQCSLLNAHCSLLTAHCSLPLLTAYCVTAHCSLLTAHYSLLTAHCSLPLLTATDRSRDHSAAPGLWSCEASAWVRKRAWTELHCRTPGRCIRSRRCTPSTLQPLYDDTASWWCQARCDHARLYREA
jgi:hypothetical protein